MLTTGIERLAAPLRQRLAAATVHLRAGVWKYRILRRLGRITVRVAAVATLRRMPPMVAAAAVIIRDGKVLMVRDTGHGRLVLPGGHLHWRESPEQGVKREVREETGYEIRLDRLAEAVSAAGGMADEGIVRLIFEASIVGGEERSSSEGAVEWLALSHLETQGGPDASIVAALTDLSAVTTPVGAGHRPAPQSPPR